MLGDVTSSSVRVWARTSTPGEFLVRYGVEPGVFEAASPPAATSIGHDNTGVLTLKGLESDTRYFYQVSVNGRHHGQPASFRTLPSEEDSRNDEFNPQGLFNFRFQIGSCANQTRCMETATGLQPTSTSIEIGRIKFTFT